MGRKKGQPSLADRVKRLLRAKFSKNPKLTYTSVARAVQIYLDRHPEDVRFQAYQVQVDKWWEQYHANRRREEKMAKEFRAGLLMRRKRGRPRSRPQQALVKKLRLLIRQKLPLKDIADALTKPLDICLVPMSPAVVAAYTQKSATSPSSVASSLESTRIDPDGTASEPHEPGAPIQFNEDNAAASTAGSSRISLLAGRCNAGIAACLNNSVTSVNKPSTSHYAALMRSKKRAFSVERKAIKALLEEEGRPEKSRCVSTFSDQNGKPSDPNAVTSIQFNEDHTSVSTAGSGSVSPQAFRRIADAAVHLNDSVSSALRRSSRKSSNATTASEATQRIDARSSHSSRSSDDLQAVRNHPAAPSPSEFECQLPLTEVNGMQSVGCAKRNAATWQYFVGSADEAYLREKLCAMSNVRFVETLPFEREQVLQLLSKESIDQQPPLVRVMEMLTHGNQPWRDIVGLLNENDLGFTIDSNTLVLLLLNYLPSDNLEFLMQRLAQENVILPFAASLPTQQTLQFFVSHFRSLFVGNIPILVSIGLPGTTGKSAFLNKCLDCEFPQYPESGVHSSSIDVSLSTESKPQDFHIFDCHGNVPVAYVQFLSSIASILLVHTSRKRRCDDALLQAIADEVEKDCTIFVIVHDQPECGLSHLKFPSFAVEQVFDLNDGCSDREHQFFCSKIFRPLLAAQTDRVWPDAFSPQFRLSVHIEVMAMLHLSGLEGVELHMSDATVSARPASGHQPGIIDSTQRDEQRQFGDASAIPAPDAVEEPTENGTSGSSMDDCFDDQENAQVERQQLDSAELEENRRCQSEEVSSEQLSTNDEAAGRSRRDGSNSPRHQLASLNAAEDPVTIEQPMNGSLQNHDQQHRRELVSSQLHFSAVSVQPAAQDVASVTVPLEGIVQNTEEILSDDEPCLRVNDRDRFSFLHHASSMASPQASLQSSPRICTTPNPDMNLSQNDVEAPMERRLPLDSESPNRNEVTLSEPAATPESFRRVFAKLERIRQACAGLESSQAGVTHENEQEVEAASDRASETSSFVSDVDGCQSEDEGAAVPETTEQRRTLQISTVESLANVQDVIASAETPDSSEGAFVYVKMVMESADTASSTSVTAYNDRAEVIDANLALAPRVPFELEDDGLPEVKIERLHERRQSEIPEIPTTSSRAFAYDADLHSDVREPPHTDNILRLDNGFPNVKLEGEAVIHDLSAQRTAPQKGKNLHISPTYLRHQTQYQKQKTPKDVACRGCRKKFTRRGITRHENNCSELRPADESLAGPLNTGASAAASEQKKRRKSTSIGLSKITAV